MASCSCQRGGGEAKNDTSQNQGLRVWFPFGFIRYLCEASFGTDRIRMGVVVPTGDFQLSAQPLAFAMTDGLRYYLG